MKFKPIAVSLLLLTLAYLQNACTLFCSDCNAKCPRNDFGGLFVNFEMNYANTNRPVIGLFGPYYGSDVLKLLDEKGKDVLTINEAVGAYFRLAGDDDDDEMNYLNTDRVKTLYLHFKDKSDIRRTIDIDTIKVGYKAYRDDSKGKCVSTFFTDYVKVWYNDSLYVDKQEVKLQSVPPITFIKK